MFANQVLTQNPTLSWAQPPCTCFQFSISSLSGSLKIQDVGPTLEASVGLHGGNRCWKYSPQKFFKTAPKLVEGDDCFSKRMKESLLISASGKVCWWQNLAVQGGHWAAPGLGGSLASPARPCPQAAGSAFWLDPWGCVRTEPGNKQAPLSGESESLFVLSWVFSTHPQLRLLSC